MQTSCDTRHKDFRHSKFVDSVNELTLQLVSIIEHWPIY